MIRKAWVVLALCAVAGLMALAFQGWRLFGPALLPLQMTFC